MPTFGAQTNTVTADKIKIAVGQNRSQSAEQSTSQGTIWNKTKITRENHTTHVNPKFENNVYLYSPQIIIEKVQGSPEFTNIISDSKIKYVDKADQHEVLSRSQKSLSAGMQLLIKATTAAAMMFATPASGFFNLAGAQASMVNAGFAALCSDAAVNLVENGGDPAKAIKSMSRNGTALNVGRAMLTAGLVTGVSELAGLTPQNVELLDYAKKAAVNAAVNTALSVAIDHQDLKQAMLQGMTTAAINTLASYGAGQIGAAYGANAIDPAVHKILHAALGGASGATAAAILGGDIKLAALSGATGAFIAETVAEMVKPDAKSEALAAVGKKLSKQEFEKQFMEKAQASANWGNFAAVVGTFAVGLDAGVAYSAAHNATEHNHLQLLAIVSASIGELYETYQVVYAIAAAGGLKALLDTIQVKSEADGSYSFKGASYKTLPEVLEILAAAPIAQTKIVVATIQKMLMDMDPNAGRPTVMETPIHEPKPVVLSTPIADPRPVLPGYEADTAAGRMAVEGFAEYDGPVATVFDAEISESGRMFGTHKELTKAKVQDSHHIIQHAAVKDIPGYDRGLAPAVQLQGPATRVGTEHNLATAEQRRAGGGTYELERIRAYRSLRQAGVSVEEAKQQVQQADQYFQSLGVDNQTVTRIPGNRKGATE